MVKDLYESLCIKHALPCYEESPAGFGLRMLRLLNG